MLSWLESYKDQIGILIQLGLLVATAVLIFVGLKQAQAASAQARAADAQASSAEQQVRMASEQLRATLMASDAALRPLLKASYSAFAGPPSADRKQYDYVIFRIANGGLGPAMNVEVYYGNNPSETAASAPFTALEVGAELTETLETARLIEDRLTIRYQSVHGSQFETWVIPLEGNIPNSVFVYKVIKEAFSARTDA